MEGFDIWNNFTPSLARGTNSHDHTYQLTSLLPKVFISVHWSAKESFVLFEKANVAL